MMHLTPVNKAMPLSFLECPPTPRVQKSVFSMDLSSPPPLPFQVKKSLEGSGSSYIVQELRPRPAFNRNAFRRLSSCPSESSETNRAMLSMEEILSRIKSSESSTLHRFFRWSQHVLRVNELIHKYMLTTVKNKVISLVLNDGLLVDDTVA
jgi:hypothetical protein